MSIFERYNVRRPPGQYPLKVAYSSFRKPMSAWQTIVGYLRKQIDIRKSLCGGCGFATLYDKNNTPYRVSKINTLDEVKAVIESIRKINSEDAGQSL